MIYDSAQRKHPAIEEILAVFRYRDLIYQLVRRDLVARYKRSYLGIAWTMLNPLFSMIILTVVFSQVFVSIPSYPGYVLTGLVCWTMFSQSTSFAMNEMVWGSQLFHQIYLPRTSFVVSTVLASMVNFILSLIPLFIILLITNVPIRISIIFLPLSMVLLFALSLGVGLLVSAVAIFFPDVSEMYPTILMAWMYISPIIIPIDILENVFNGILLYINPFYYALNIFRELVFNGVVPGIIQWLIASVIIFAVFALGWIIFCNKADDFTYYV